MKRSQFIVMMVCLSTILTVAVSSALAAPTPSSGTPWRSAAALQVTGTPTVLPKFLAIPLVQLGGSGRFLVTNEFDVPVTMTIDGTSYTIPGNAKGFVIDLKPGNYTWVANVPGFAEGTSTFVVAPTMDTYLMIGKPLVIGTATPTPPATTKPGDVESVDDLTKQISLDTKNVEAYQKRGMAYLTLGSYDLAIADFSKVLELDSQRADAFLGRGLAYGGKAQTQQAIGDLNTFLKLAPDSPHRPAVEKAIRDLGGTPFTGTTAVALAATPTGVPPSGSGTPASTETSVIFTDDFSAGTCALSNIDDAEHKFGCENGVYSMLSKKENVSWWQYYSGIYSDVVIETDARVPTGDTGVAYGIIFRVSSNGSAFYLFNLSPDGQYSLYYYDRENKWKALIPYTASTAIKTGGEWNRLKVVAQGSQIAVYANNQFLDTAIDTRLTGGSVGFVLQTDAANGIVTFDNLIVAKINRPLVLPAAKQRPPTPTPLPTIPAGMGGVVVVNYFGFEAYVEIAGKRYTVGANDRLYIQLPPGKYPISVTVGGKRLACTGACMVEVFPGVYTPWSMG